MRKIGVALAFLGLVTMTSCTAEAQDNFLSWIQGTVGGTTETSSVTESSMTDSSLTSQEESSSSSEASRPDGQWPNPFLVPSFFPAYSTVLPRTDMKKGSQQFEAFFGDGAVPEVSFKDVLQDLDLPEDTYFGIAVSFRKDSGSLRYWRDQPVQNSLDGYSWELSDDLDVLYVWKSAKFESVPEDFRPAGIQTFIGDDGQSITTSDVDGAIVQVCTF